MRANGKNTKERMKIMCQTNNGFVMGDTGLVVLGYRSTLLMSKPNILGLLELNLIYILNSYKPNEK